MPAWPRGSSISSCRSSSPLFRSQLSFSAIVRPGTEGPPLHDEPHRLTGNFGVDRLYWSA